MKLLIATHNQGKVNEISEMLAGAGVDCLSLKAAHITIDVEETGTTFLENATLKAVQYAQMSRFLTLADDSGLEVEALDWQPGVYTARYGGREITQAARNALLLSQLAGLPDEQRAARFRCIMVLVDGEGNMIASSEGVCEGRIAHEPAGDGGFGYDPIFYLPEKGCTTAQLSSADKHAISHRGRALRAILPAVINYMV